MTRRETSTEIRNPRTLALDESDTQEVLKSLFAEDARAVEAASRAVGDLTRAVDAALGRITRGGRVHYFGAGTSGRLALADAMEIGPTFGVDERSFTAHFPGGWKAVMDSTVDLEDSDDLGYEDAAELTAEDVAFGVTASGATAYVRGAFRRSRERGAVSLLLTCDPNAPLRSEADICIVAETGPEVLTGSTRLKAGTATKVILSAFSTALMVRSGRTYSNLMVGLRVSNRKLRERATTILVEATGRGREDCQATLDQVDGKVEVALLVLRTGCSVEAAESTLDAEGSVRDALAALGG
jgi:N-acetylmuramic acid 6-phosphate etherase